MNSLLLIALFLQVALLLGGIGFLWRERHIIVPASVWWAFLMSDLLWLALIADLIARLSDYSLIPLEVTVIISLAITSLFLFRLWMRYQAHRKKQLLNKILLEHEQRLEQLRADDERLHRHDWNYIKPFPFRGR